MIQLRRNSQERDEPHSIKRSICCNRTIQEYIELARVPNSLGYTGKVVEILKARVGKLDLAVERVVEQIGVSKRTLQRRLQEEETNYAQLRDDVRFHYAIKYLIHDRRLISDTSIALDFSDRTSFNVAFKRWTGLSPSVFQQLYTT